MRHAPVNYDLVDWAIIGLVLYVLPVGVLALLVYAYIKRKRVP